MNFFTILIYIILICVLLFFVNKFLSQFKFPKIGAISVFTGGVKCGKSGTSLACAVAEYKRILRSWRLKCLLRRIANNFRKPENKKEFEEKPLFYSNIPLAKIDYIQLTTEHLLLQVRINRKSVVFLDESSLIADSMLIKDLKVNTALLKFFKLFGHITHGGKCIVNTHCITDLHFALKRTTSQYFYIHHLSKYIPFFTLCYMREERYSEDNTATNIYDNDLEESLKKCLFRTSVFKKYDPFCYSGITDNLETKNIIIYHSTKDSLKASKIPSFRTEFAEMVIENKENK